MGVVASSPIRKFELAATCLHSEGPRLCRSNGAPPATDSRPCFTVPDGQRGTGRQSVCRGLVAVAVVLILAVCVAVLT